MNDEHRPLHPTSEGCDMISDIQSKAIETMNDEKIQTAEEWLQEVTLEDISAKNLIKTFHRYAEMRIKEAALNQPDPTTEKPSVLPSDDEIIRRAENGSKLHGFPERAEISKNAYKWGALYVRDIAEPIIATQQSEIERLKAELSEIRSAIDKALLPENIECDGAHCHGCYKDILRPYITNQSQKQKR